MFVCGFGMITCAGSHHELEAGILSLLFDVPEATSKKWVPCRQVPGGLKDQLMMVKAFLSHSKGTQIHRRKIVVRRDNYLI